MGGGCGRDRVNEVMKESRRNPVYEREGLLVLDTTSKAETGD